MIYLKSWTLLRYGKEDMRAHHTTAPADVPPTAAGKGRTIAALIIAVASLFVFGGMILAGVAILRLAGSP